MPTYLSPGVYVEEIPAGPKPIEAVGTSTAGFVGRAPKKAAHVNKVLAVNSKMQFFREYASSDTPGVKFETTELAQAVVGFFNNGGRRCYIVNIGDSDTIIGDGSARKGIDLFEEIDEIAIVAAPGFWDAASYEAILTHCEKLKDRFAILDPPPSSQITDLELLKKVAVSQATRKRKKEGEEGGGSPPGRANISAGFLPRESPFAAFYFPRVIVPDVFSPKDLIESSVSGHLAGIYARTDATRGVHKAPANEPLRVLGLSYNVTRGEQDELNPLGVNCIRMISGQGIRVWGARTRAADPEWRYINVRRLFNMIEESIIQSTSWVVFEPNDRSLWKKITRDVEAFLKLLWRQGALMGSSPEEAFFVQCDEETNPPESIDAGMVITRIGIAPVKPTEFVVFQLQQSLSGSAIEES